MLEEWFLLESGKSSAAANMAWDEALLGAVRRIGTPVLRFYGWNQPAASFGYFQRIAEIEAWTTLRPLVRRPTGGGLVPHESDWTYSLVVPPTHWWYKLRAEESYRRLHEWIHEAFARLQLPTELATTAAKRAPGQCFAGPEKSDLLFRGDKIAGAAQRRCRDGLLIQGSIQPVPSGIARSAWHRAMCDSAADRLAVRWAPLKPNKALVTAAGELSAAKYSQDGFNRRR